MASVYKLPIALQLLRRIDRGELRARHVGRQAVDEKYVEAALRFAIARKVKPRGGDEARALRRRQAFACAAEHLH